MAYSLIISGVIHDPIRSFKGPAVKKKPKPRKKFTISNEAHRMLQNAAASLNPPVHVSFLLETLIIKHLRNFDPVEVFRADV